MHNSFEMKLERHCFDLNFDIRAFRDLEDMGLFYWKLWNYDSGLYWKIQVSSSGTALF
jgi:hypothetical protein